jgi:hypothetical protein
LSGSDWLGLAIAIAAFFSLTAAGVFYGGGVWLRVAFAQLFAVMASLLIGLVAHLRIMARDREAERERQRPEQARPRGDARP